MLAQMGRERAPSLLDIPTGIEAGFPELEMDGNVGLFGSKALSAKLRERIGADVVTVSDDKAIDDKLNATAQTPSRGGDGFLVAEVLPPMRQVRRLNDDIARHVLETQVLYSITKHAMRRSADEIRATSISFRPKVFSDPASVVD